MTAEQIIFETFLLYKAMADWVLDDDDFVILQIYADALYNE